MCHLDEKSNHFLHLAMFLPWLNKCVKTKYYPFLYWKLSNYFSLEIVSVTEFPEEHRVQVNVAINIWMDRQSSGDLLQKCLNMQDKWKINCHSKLLRQYHTGNKNVFCFCFFLNQNTTCLLDYEDILHKKAHVLGY